MPIMGDTMGVVFNALMHLSLFPEISPESASYFLHVISHMNSACPYLH